MKIPFINWQLTRKESAAGPAGVAMQVGQPQYTGKLSESRDKYSEEAMRSVVAYAAVSQIAKAFGSVEFYPATLDRDGTPKDVAAPDLLRVWNRPNPTQSGAQFRELWATFYAIHGEAFQERVGNGAGRPTELWLHFPERMGVIPGSTGIPQAYEYTGPSGQKVRWPVNAANGDSDILHTRAPNPADRWRGLAPTFPAGASIDANNDGREWNAALLQNSARPSGILSVDGELDDDQRARLKMRIDERYSGAANAGRPLVIEGGMSWQSTSITPKDMEWIESNRETARAIALAYGVPPMLLGIPGDNTYSNYREARLAFYDDTVLPMVNLYAQEMSHWFAARFNPSFVILPNLDKIEALDFRRERKWDRVQNADFLTVDEKRKALGYDPLGPGLGGDLVPVVQQFGALTFSDLDADPEAAGRRAFGDDDGAD